LITTEGSSAAADEAASVGPEIIANSLGDSGEIRTRSTLRESGRLFGRLLSSLSSGGLSSSNSRLSSGGLVSTSIGSLSSRELGNSSRGLRSRRTRAGARARARITTVKYISKRDLINISSLGKTINRLSYVNIELMNITIKYSNYIISNIDIIRNM
jgi:hypothetical protein